MQIKNILFPVDFSERSLALNPEVEWLAARFESKVTLLHVFEIPISWYGSGEAPLMSPDCFMQFKEDAAKRTAGYPLRLPESRVERVTAEGDPAWVIKDWVEGHDVDLVMMGTHGYGPVRRLLLGSVAMKVLHDVNCPVWTQTLENPCPAAVADGISKIICAVELTDEALPLLRFTKDLARDLDASVHVVHSTPETEARPYKYFDRDLHGFLTKAAGEEIARLQQEAGTEFPISFTAEPIGKFCAKFSADEKAGLIIIGRGKTQELLGTLRTHTYDILRQSPCPVLSFSAELGRHQSTDSVAAQTPELTGVR